MVPSGPVNLNQFTLTNLVDTFSQCLEPVHVDDGGGDGHDDAEHGRTEAAAAANLDLK